RGARHPRALGRARGRADRVQAGGPPRPPGLDAPAAGARPTVRRGRGLLRARTAGALARASYRRAHRLLHGLAGVPGEPTLQLDEVLALAEHPTPLALPPERPAQGRRQALGLPGRARALEPAQ